MAASDYLGLARQITMRTRFPSCGHLLHAVYLPLPRAKLKKTVKDAICRGLCCCNYVCARIRLPFASAIGFNCLRFKMITLHAKLSCRSCGRCDENVMTPHFRLARRGLVYMMDFQCAEWPRMPPRLAFRQASASFTGEIVLRISGSACAQGLKTHAQHA
jgi:hypothetical protein